MGRGIVCLRFDDVEPPGWFQARRNYRFSVTLAARSVFAARCSRSAFLQTHRIVSDKQPEDVYLATSWDATFDGWRHKALETCA
jgi:hypothetical protein